MLKFQRNPWTALLKPDPNRLNHFIMAATIPSIDIIHRFYLTTPRQKIGLVQFLPASCLRILSHRVWHTITVFPVTEHSVGHYAYLSILVSVLPTTRRPKLQLSNHLALKIKTSKSMWTSLNYIPQSIRVGGGLII